MLIKSSSKLDRSLAEPKFCTLKPVDHLIDPKGYQYSCYNLMSQLIYQESLKQWKQWMVFSHKP